VTKGVLEEKKRINVSRGVRIILISEPKNRVKGKLWQLRWAKLLERFTWIQVGSAKTCPRTRFRSGVLCTEVCGSVP
jgi:hypothetical protein